MVSYSNESNYENSCSITNDRCEYVRGNVTEEIEVNKYTKACEIRADIQVKRVRGIRIWGRVIDCKNKPVKNALVKLVRAVVDECGKVRYKGIAHGTTDCLGFYQFEVCKPKKCVSAKYRIFVSKQALGKEIFKDETECDPCSEKIPCKKDIIIKEECCN